MRLGIWLVFILLPIYGFSQSGLSSIETEYTISKVRTATNNGNKYIVGSSHEGVVIGVDYNGQTLWSNALSGYMNHDLWCEDITGDGKDEILVANADGKLYCLSDTGELMWEFSQNEAPMFSVCVITQSGTPYVVCGGFDLNIYYLSATGELIKTIASSTYSIEKTFGDNAPPDGIHIANFIRKIKATDGEEDLLVHGCTHTNATNGSLYFFEPLANLPYKTADPLNGKPVGDLRVTNYFGTGLEQVLLGSSTIHNTMDLSIYKPDTDQMDYVKLYDKKSELGGHSYRVIQSEVIPKGSSYEYFTLAGQSIALIPPNQDLDQAEYLNANYAYNDMWHDKENDRIILASSQSGGSAIHLIDYTNPNWKTAYENLSPPGKIQQILENTQIVKANLATFTKPNWERTPKEVFFVSDLSTSGIPSSVSELVADINSKYSSPVLLGSKFMKNVQDPNDWNRNSMSNAFYRDARDSRRNYTLTQQQVLDEILPDYAAFPGISTWGGHGNDPYMYSLDTKKALLDAANANGKKTILIYPELEKDNDDFPWMIEDLMYPLATYASTRNAQIHIRTKHIFWQGSAHRPIWSRMISGEFADVFVPSMEETGDKSQELSVSARMGYWLSGAVNQWGTRAVPDNSSFGRLRQFSSQRLPNHHLRQQIYALASGATHLNNFIVDREYTSLAWELVAKGALYVPNRDEILSISPVHVSMTDEPDDTYLADGSEVKWVVKYDEMHEQNNKLVFSRLNGTWMGSPNTEWDFSRYAANETERRLNYIPAYNNGLVLITPVQNGALAQNNLPRGKMVDKLHPYYENIMQEFITDGRNYISEDNTSNYAADTYYTTVQTAIEESAGLLPITVSGDVGWVVAQTDPLHLRLTLIDGGYINPSDKEVTVSFNTMTPIKVMDVLDGEVFDLINPDEVTVAVPCGMFRFIDIELGQPLNPPSSPNETICKNEITTERTIADYEVKNSATTIVSSNTVKEGGNLTLQAGQSITLQPGFNAETGCDFLAFIALCTTNSTATEPITTQRLKQDFAPKSEGQFLIRPNPLNSQTQLVFYLEKATKTALYIHNMQGQQLLSQTNQFSNKGWNNRTIDASQFPAGIYQVTLVTDSEKWTRKIVVGR